MKEYTGKLKSEKTTTIVRNITKGECFQFNLEDGIYYMKTEEGFVSLKNGFFHYAPCDLDRKCYPVDIQYVVVN